MARRRKNSLLGAFLQLAVFLFFLGSSSLAAFWNSLTPQLRIAFSITIAVIFLSGTALVILWFRYRKYQRELAWNQAMSAWNQNRKNQLTGQNTSSRHLTPMELEKFTAQVFKKMGYRVSLTAETGDHGIDVRMINPKGQIEVVQCKQWNRPVGEPEVRDLSGAMVKERAVRGFLVAPYGFSEAARKWAKGTAVVLIDEREFDRIIMRAYENK
jgi:hypothetical protein